jgi:hypothetical protein
MWLIDPIYAMQCFLALKTGQIQYPKMEYAVTTFAKSDESSPQRFVLYSYAMM